MRLNIHELGAREEWRRNGFVLPEFDIAGMIRATRAEPTWVHFGAGNIFRVFPAVRQQALLNADEARTGIVVAEGYDWEIIDRVYRPFDNLSVAVILKENGDMEKTVVASIAESLKARPGDPDFERLREIFRSPSLQMVTFTITEKGYRLDWNGQTIPAVADDLRDGPAEPKSFPGMAAALVYERYRAGGGPLALVSMDNCSHNGEVLRGMVTAFARAWSGAGLTDAGFADYVGDEERLAFPWTMIDKITPRPDARVAKALAEAGLSGMGATITAKDTYIAPYVNAEEIEYLVVEDSFPNGRPALEKAGVIFTDRTTVDRAERMKVSTCLNPIHTAIGIFGCLLGFDSVADLMRDPDIGRFAAILGYDEGMKVVADPGVIDPKVFLREVLERRFANPYVPDTPQRLTTDASQGFPVRFGVTINAYMARKDLDPRDLRCIPLALAGWFRYLLRVDDEGRPYELSPDPVATEKAEMLAGRSVGGKETTGALLRPVLSDRELFGTDLAAAGLTERIEDYFSELSSGWGAVRRVLHRVVSE